MGTELVRIGNRAFVSCHRLKAVYLPDTVTEVGPYAFDVCRGLESVRLPARMRCIRIGMFECCYELRQVTFPEDLEEIGASAFNRSSKVRGRLPVQYHGTVVIIGVQQNVRLEGVCHARRLTTPPRTGAVGLSRGGGKRSLRQFRSRRSDCCAR
jgi:hypothetical protein